MLLGLKSGAEVDWWALGIVMYKMMFGQNPFQFLAASRYARNILRNRVFYPQRLTFCAVSILKQVNIFNIKTEALRVPYSFLNSLCFHT